MYKKSEIKTQQILDLYSQGIILTKICEETKTSQPTVKKILKENGIDYNDLKKIKYQEKLEQVKVLYEQGKSQLYIEKELGLTRKTIRELLKSSDIYYKSKSEQWRIRYGNTLKEDVFETITLESAYWIGMLYTDGHITKTTNCVDLGFHSNDKDHLKKYLGFLHSSNTIEKTSNRNFCRVRIGSERLYKSLQSLGFTNQKSWNAIPPKCLENSRDFWRGCIDGDGGIYNPYSRHGTKQISICGTLDTIIRFIEFCQNNTNITSKKYPTQKEGKCLFAVSYYGKEAEQIADLLYKDSTIYLERKYNIYKSW